MKGLFISYSQAYNEEILDVLDAHGQRGFTRWNGVDGRGSVDGEPHYGSHAWPSQNQAMLTFVPDEKVENLIADLKSKDEETPELGLRVFLWDASQGF
jgi:hypothetical protein